MSDIIFTQKKFNYLKQISSLALLPHLKIQNSFPKFTCWAQDVSYLTEKSVLSVCALEASSFHVTLVWSAYWTMTGFQASCDVTKSCSCVHVKPRFKVTEKLSADKCENSLQVTRTSFCTVKLNHPREVTTNKTHCWVEGDKRILHETEQWLLYPFVLEDIIYRIKLIRDVFSSVGEETDTQRYSINATLLAWWLMQKDKTIALLITACEVLIGFKWTLLHAHPSTNLHPKNITEFQRPSPILRRSSLCCLGFCLRLPGAQSRESSSKMPIIHR